MPTPLYVDPFEIPAPAYAPSRAFRRVSGAAGDSTVIVHALANALGDAGWSLTASAQSFDEQIVSSVPVSTPTPPPSPTQLSPGACYLVNVNDKKITAAPGSGVITDASLGSLTFRFYDPGVSTPPASVCPNGVRWVATGASADATYGNLKAAVEANTNLTFDVLAVPAQYQSGPGYNPATSRLLKFRPRDSTIIDYDNASIQFGAGRVISNPLNSPVPLTGATGNALHGGYYRLRSATLNGAWLEVTAQNWLGYGSHCCYVQLRASGGGANAPFQQYLDSLEWTNFFSTALIPAYWIAANPYQIIVWPDSFGYFNGSSISALSAMLIASLLWTDTAKMPAGAAPVLVAGANSDGRGYQSQVRTRGYWNASCATGISGDMNSTTFFQTVNASGVWRTPIILSRGLRGASLLTRTGEPLIEAPYVAMAHDPEETDGAPARIAGKLWDTVILTAAGFARGASSSPNVTATPRGLPDATWEREMTYDGHRWRMLADCKEPGSDLWVSLWVAIS